MRNLIVVATGVAIVLVAAFLWLRFGGESKPVPATAEQIKMVFEAPTQVCRTGWSTVYTGNGNVRWNFYADNGVLMTAIFNSEKAFLFEEYSRKVAHRGSPDILLKYGTNNLFYTLEHGDCVRWDYDGKSFLIPASVYKSPVGEATFRP